MEADAVRRAIGGNNKDLLGFFDARIVGEAKDRRWTIGLVLRDDQELMGPLNQVKRDREGELEIGKCANGPIGKRRIGRPDNLRRGDSRLRRYAAWAVWRGPPNGARFHADEFQAGVIFELVKAGLRERRARRELGPLVERVVIAAKSKSPDICLGGLAAGAGKIVPRNFSFDRPALVVVVAIVERAAASNGHFP